MNFAKTRTNLKNELSTLINKQQAEQLVDQLGCNEMKAITFESLNGGHGLVMISVRLSEKFLN